MYYTTFTEEFKYFREGFYKVYFISEYMLKFYHLNEFPKL